MPVLFFISLSYAALLIDPAKSNTITEIRNAIDIYKKE